MALADTSSAVYTSTGLGFLFLLKILLLLLLLLLLLQSCTEKLRNNQVTGLKLALFNYLFIFIYRLLWTETV